MGAAAEFVKDHPFLTFFIATAAIQGAVTLIRGRDCRCEELRRFPYAPGSTSLEITTRYPWVTISQSPQVYTAWPHEASPVAAAAWPGGHEWG